MCDPESAKIVSVSSDVLVAAEADFGFFFNDTATTEIYTLSLHDALPISYMSLTCICTANSPRYVERS